MRKVITSDNRNRTLTGPAMTARQLKQINRLMEDATDALGLTQSDAQSIIEQGGEMQLRIQQALESLRNDEYYRQEIDSSYHYSPTHQIKPLSEQIAILIQHFPSLNLLGIKSPRPGILDQKSLNLPEGAEGWFAIPKFEAIAGLYHDAANCIFDKIKQEIKDIKINGYPVKERGANIYDSYTNALKRISLYQTGDIIIIPAQFGLRHVGRSMHRADECLSDNEFCLDLFTILCMILTHPDRFFGSPIRSDNEPGLGILCPGGLWHSGRNVDSVLSLIYHSMDNDTHMTLEFMPDNETAHNIGLATGFLV